MKLELIASMLIGYALGNIQTAYLIGKIVKNIDIREHGSGNAGTSNITTIMGIKYGVVVGLVDVLKAFLAVTVVKLIYPENPELAFLAGMMAVIGHIFPFYMKFRGGKGVAALVGMMFGVSWKLGILFALLVIVPALVTDYIVSGSFTTFVALPVVSHFTGKPLAYTMLGIGLLALCFYLHRHNIQRIFNKEELKISEVLFKKKAQA